MKLGKAMSLLLFAAGILISTWTTQVSASATPPLDNIYKHWKDVKNLKKERAEVEQGIITTTARHEAKKKETATTLQLQEMQDLSNTIAEWGKKFNDVERRIAELQNAPAVTQNGKL
eukprot:GHVT01007260.1.p1 GENE.GHVT01007260.1~~GHVT01007260.1.p1  ORF type:complete len:117 (+),score=18.38 GHVT01007260.1:48-398(+)